MSLVPTLTPLDRRVLSAIDTPVGIRARDVARDVNQPLSDTLLILRGLEAIGYAEQAGGWWIRSRP